MKTASLAYQLGMHAAHEKLAIAGFAAARGLASAGRGLTRGAVIGGLTGAAGSDEGNRLSGALRGAGLGALAGGLTAGGIGATRGHLAAQKNPALERLTRIRAGQEARGIQTGQQPTVPFNDTRLSQEITGPVRREGLLGGAIGGIGGGLLGAKKEPTWSEKLKGMVGM